LVTKKASASIRRGLFNAQDKLPHKAGNKLISKEKFCISRNGRAVQNTLEGVGIWSGGGTNAAEIG
jgi:hypothetical protein